VPVDPLTAAVRHALRDAPCSIRALAREAGVSHSTLVLINGGSLNASVEVADAVRRALLIWGERCGRLAGEIAQKRNPKGG
jgi:lambda repressor-like predicted transcriptional regulator